MHGIIKKNLKLTIRKINDSLMDTVAACGDVNRNVMCNPNPNQSRLHAEALEVARAISAHLTPATRAYHEIWLEDENGEKQKITPDPEPEEEPPITAKPTCHGNSKPPWPCRRATMSTCSRTTLASSR